VRTGAGFNTTVLTVRPTNPCVLPTLQCHITQLECPTQGPSTCTATVNFGNSIVQH
jgi:hypothetical protein